VFCGVQSRDAADDAADLWSCRKGILMRGNLLKPVETVPESDGIDIRWMDPSDADAVLRIESQSFQFPLSKEELKAMRLQPDCVGVVAEIDRRIVGYVLFAAQTKILNIISFAVAPEHRRCGVGTKIIEKMKLNIKISNRDAIALEVRETNLPAQLFFQKKGFLATAVLNGRWPELNDEAAYVMCFRGEPLQVATTKPSHRMTRKI
jgi:[ribosomal protein S18]-alanine N-acetyltransferase